MSGLLMTFNDHSDCGARVPFNPVVLKKVGAYTPFHQSLILL